MEVAISISENEAQKLKVDAQDVHGHESGHKVSVTKYKPCYRCGETNDTPDKCFYKNSQCHTRNDIGHMHKVCSEKKSGQHKKQKRKFKLNIVSEDQEEDNNEIEH